MSINEWKNKRRIRFKVINAILFRNADILYK